MAEIIGTLVMTFVILSIIGTILFAIGKSTGGFTAGAGIFLMVCVIWLNDILRPKKQLKLPEKMKEEIQKHL